VTKAASRICSLLPSATEIVFALGLEHRLVAVTHECDFPPEAARFPVITRSTLADGMRRSRDIHAHITGALHGGSSIYHLDQDLLQRLAPDLILTQELCDVCAVSYDTVEHAVRRLPGSPTILSLEPTTLHAILDTIRQVGEATGADGAAETLVLKLERQIKTIADRAQRAARRPRVFALEWLDPPFTAGHWVPQMIGIAGGDAGVAREGLPSTQISWRDIAEYDPEIVVLMPCGFTLERTVEEVAAVSFPEEWNELSAVRSGRVYAVNGSAYFNRPGPRVTVGLQVLAEIIDPEACPRTTPREAWRRLSESNSSR
jgi:iron complex transport system substrate-binding protein